MRSSRRLRFTPEAKADLREILQYTRETWGQAQRDVYEAAIDRAFDRIVAFPELGTARPELFPGCLIRVIEEHIIYYRIVDHGIWVIRVLHHRRDAAAMLGGLIDEPES